MKASMSRIALASPPRSRATGWRFIRNSTSRMWPVRPMPPTVARKSSGSSRRAALHDAPVGHAHAQARHVRAEAAVDVMVLAVDVGRHHAAQGDELGARRDGQEEAARQEEPVQRRTRERPASARSTPLAASNERMRSASVVFAARGWLGRRQRGVAVGAAEPARQHRVPGEGEQVLGADLAPRPGQAAPAGQHGRAALQIRRSTAGKCRQTGTPQKCSPSVQVGVMRPARSTQGGPMCFASAGWTARSWSSSSMEAR